MNKEQLIRQHPELKLYDVSSLIELRNYKANLKHHQNEGNTTDHLKKIAPFGTGNKADFYYFESENTPISEQILEEMGFGSEGIEEWNILVCKILIEVFFTEKPSVFINEREKNLNANQLYQLITLLS